MRLLDRLPVLQREWKRSPGEILRAFLQHECFFLAAGISFYFLLSLIPMLFLLLAVIGHFLADVSVVQEDLLEAVRVYIPFVSNEIIRNIDQVVQKPALLGWIGGASLFLSADLVFVAVQSSLDKIFLPGRRGFLKSKMLSVVSAVVVALVVLGTVAINAVTRSLGHLEAVRRMAIPPGEVATVGLHLSEGVIAALMLGCFTLAVRVLPHVSVPVRHALGGGVLATGLWLVGKRYYVWYLENVSRVGPLFGSLSAVILTLVWVYVSTAIFLLGAELTRWLALTDPRRAERIRQAAAMGDESITA